MRCKASPTTVPATQNGIPRARELHHIFVQSAAPATKNKAKVLPLSDKTAFDTLWNTCECHEVPCLPRKTTL